MTPGSFDEALARFKASRASGSDRQEQRYDQVASNDPTFVPANVPVKADERYLSPRERLDRAEALFGLGSNEWAADASQPRNPGLTSRDEAGNEEYPQVKMAASGGGRRPWSILEGLLNDAMRKGQIRRNSNARPELPWRTQTPEPTPATPSSPSMRESFSRIGNDVGPAFDRSVKLGEVKSVNDLSAYTRDIASKSSDANPTSNLPRFLFELPPLKGNVAGNVSNIHDDIVQLARRSLNLPNTVVDKLYGKGSAVGNKALAQLPDLLAEGAIFPNKSRNGQRRVAVVGPWGKAGDKLVAILELARSGKSAEIVTIHPMPKRTFDKRKESALAIGASALLSLDEDDE